ncbi:MAG TPA: XapX domain protein [Verrucomicrobiales bacterium]|nr:XapX domain protein [Verrucomicrobiales bacterium]
MEILLAFAVGILVGIIFSACKLPVPAPPALAGVVGIAGIYLGAHAWPLLARIFS